LRGNEGAFNDLYTVQPEVIDNLGGVPLFSFIRVRTHAGYHRIRARNAVTPCAVPDVVRHLILDYLISRLSIDQTILFSRHLVVMEELGIGGHAAEFSHFAPDVQPDIKGLRAMIITIK